LEEISVKDFREAMEDRIAEFLTTFGIKDVQAELKKMTFSELLNIYLNVWMVELLLELNNLLRSIQI
jgi:hypothetical protein